MKINGSSNLLKSYLFMYNISLGPCNSFSCKPIFKYIYLPKRVFLDLECSSGFPVFLGPRPQKYCKNKFMNKAYYLFKIILIQG